MSPPLFEPILLLFSSSEKELEMLCSKRLPSLKIAEASSKVSVWFSTRFSFLFQNNHVQTKKVLWF